MDDLTGQIRESLIDRILSGEYRPGDRLMSEREFAERHEISRITVRRAFAQLESAGIIVRKRPHGTYVANTFRAHRGELRSIGVITTLPHEFSGAFVEEVSRCCEKEDILLALGIPEPDTADAQLKIAVRMASRGVKNLIIWGAEKGGSIPMLERLRILGVNLVFFDQVIPGNFADYVGLDNFHAVETLFDEAVKRGAKRLFFIGFSGTAIDSNREREEAFRKKLRQSGLPGGVRELPVDADADTCRKFAGRILEEAGENGAVIGINAPVMQDLFRVPPRGTALYCVDHPRRLEELHVTGYAQPIAAMAHCAVQMLRDQCRKGEAWRPVRRRFTGELTAAGE